MKADQAGRPLPPKSLNILVGLTLKLDSLCIIVKWLKTSGRFDLFLEYFELQAWKGFCFGRDLPKCEDLVEHMAEMAQNIEDGHWLVMNCALTRLVHIHGDFCIFFQLMTRVLEK